MTRTERCRASPIYFVACLLLGCTPPTSAQSLEERVRQGLTDADLSGAVLVTKGGSTILSAAYGLANRELGVANTPTTRFRIGSITKQFTAMAVMILQDQGKLQVSDRVGKHLTQVPTTWQGLTIHQLLTHTSGIMHSWTLPGFNEIAMVPISLDATLELFFDQPLLFEPGSDFLYSGVGYFLLARIVQEVSHQDYDTFLEAQIFSPLGMENTGPDRPSVVLEKRASGYVTQGPQIQNAPWLFAPILTGGGHLYSTVEDLARWDRGLASHALISSEAYAVMYRPDKQNYAYG
jgi:CubicO group peptidase (beta-lactamase class C family)